MRNFVALIFTLISFSLFSQSSDFDSLFQQGKEEFYKDSDNRYNIAVDKLEQAIRINSDNAEAHYFLGYAYSRLNSSDGKGMINMNVKLTLLASEQFEIVNKLTPKYDGEIIVLDPYSKLTAEWGSMALSYWHNNKPDSALWAFKEGKKRGGFGDFYLSISRKALDFCSKNAILMSSGDNFTIPLWYLQIVENYRNDVIVVDISLLNTIWYPKFLLNNQNISFGFSGQELDSVQYIQWSDSTFVIDFSSNDFFSWTVKPSYYDQYLLRGDRLFLNMLMDNKFQRDVFFTTGFYENQRLSLKDYLISMILIDRINHNQKPKILFNEYNVMINSVIDCTRYLNTNSQEELNFVDVIRYNIFARIIDCINSGDKKEAKMLMEIIDSRLNSGVYPFQTEQGLKYYQNLKQNI